jgi:hypothetical protein
MLFNPVSFLEGMELKTSGWGMISTSKYAKFLMEVSIVVLNKKMCSG